MRKPFYKIPRFKPYFKYLYNLSFLKYLLGWNYKDSIDKFEKKFAKYIGTKYAIATSSGTTSLYLCLKVLGCKEGEEILVPNYIVPEVIHIMKKLQLKPVFVDVGKNSFNINPENIEKRISKKTKYILMLHLYGYPCDVKSIQKIVKKYKLKIIEDAAQACGAEYKGKKIGSFGDLSYFSFGLLKNFNTIGGGMITTNNKNYYKKLIKENSKFKRISLLVILYRLLLLNVLMLLTSPLIFSIFTYNLLRFSFVKNIVYDFLKKEDVTSMSKKIFSKKYLRKFSKFQARIGLEELKNLDNRNKARIKIAKRYNSLLKKSELDRKNVLNIYLNYPIIIDNPNEFMKILFKNGIDTSKGYVKYFYSNIKKENGFFVKDKIVHLPLYQNMRKNDVDYIIKVLSLINSLL